MNTLYKLANYNYWANEQLLAHFYKIGSLVPQSCLRLFSHILNAQSVWLGRINYQPSEYGIFQEHSLPDCKKLHETTSEVLQKLFQSSDLDFNLTITYKNSTGEEFTNSLEDILIQIFNHGTYHRAQIAKELRLNQIEPINTDYITYVRELK